MSDERPLSEIMPGLVAMLQHVPLMRELDFTVVEFERGYATFRMAYQERLIGDPETGVLGGGVITTLIDSVCGMAVQTALREPVTIATLDLRIDYLRPSTPGSPLHARAECYKVARHVAFTRATAWNDDPASPIAHSVGTFMLASPSSRRKREKAVP
jgi:uncharacterized protein (TIGR00369 family)